MANSRFNVHPVGKVVYWVKHMRFYNSKNKHDGLEKAQRFCLDNFLPFRDIQKFDSDTETNYYEYLLDLEEKGLIKGINHHYTLRIYGEEHNCKGDEIPEVTYTADFVYKDNMGKTHIIDVKSSEYFLTNDGGRFLLIKNIFDREFKKINSCIEVILPDGKSGWREWKPGDKFKSQKLIKKQREELRKLKAEKHQAQIMENKAAREKARLKELRDKPKLTSAERKRLKELEEKLMI